MRLHTRFRKRSLALLAGAAAIGMLASGCTADSGGEEGADPIRLTYASFTAASSPHAEAFVWLAEELEARTDGRVTIEPFFSGGLCGVADIVTCQKDGRADLGIWLPWQNPQEFPLASVVGVLFVTRDTWAHTEAFNTLLEENEALRAEFTSQGLTPLYAGPVGPAILGTNEVVENLDWIDGKAIRTTGYFTDAIELVGGNPVAIPNAETYESLQRGVIDAFFATTLDGAAIDNSLYEVTKNWQDLGTGEYANVVTTISEQALNKLTDEEQEILFELTREVREKWWDEYYFPAMDVACQNAIDGGLETMTVWEEGRADEFREVAAEPIRQKWMDNANSAGADAEAFFDDYTSMIDQKEAESPLEATATERCAATFAQL